MRSTYNPKRQLSGVAADIFQSGGHMLSGGFLQEIHEQSEVQNYAIGTRLHIDDRVFRYCKARSALKAGHGARNNNYPREGNISAVEFEAGSYTITLPMNDHGVDYTLEQTLNYWAEGFIWIMYSDQTKGFGHQYRIKSSTVASGTIPTQYVTLTLYEALHEDVAASCWITAWPNIYSNIRDADYQKSSVVCVPPRPVTSGYFFWGQTWGPCQMQQTHAAGGLENDDRMFFFHENNPGQIVTGSQVADIKLSQFAGFLLTNTTAWTNVGDAGEAGGDAFCNLQLNP